MARHARTTKHACTDQAPPLEVSFYSSPLTTLAQGPGCQGSVVLFCTHRNIKYVNIVVQYTSAGGILPEDATSSDVRAPWEGNSRYDLRSRENNIGLVPFKYASLMDGMSTTLERMLHPALPLALVIRQSDPEWRGHEGGACSTDFVSFSSFCSMFLSKDSPRNMHCWE